MIFSILAEDNRSSQPVSLFKTLIISDLGSIARSLDGLDNLNMEFRSQVRGSVFAQIWSHPASDDCSLPGLEFIHTHPRILYCNDFSMDIAISSTSAYDSNRRRWNSKLCAVAPPFSDFGPLVLASNLHPV